MFETTTVTDNIGAESPAANPAPKRNAAAPASVAPAKIGRSKRSAPTVAKPSPTATATHKAPSKSALVLKLLARAKGATIAEMEEPTGWQPHSTRAFLSGLRKKGMTVTREQRKTGETAYRTGTAAGISLSVATTLPDDNSTPTSEGDVGLSGSGGAAADLDASAGSVTDTVVAPEAAA